jgi:malate dehydrogenase (quinone)
MELPDPTGQPVDVVLIGAGIMSATLGTLLRALEPTRSIHVYERLDRAAAESSAPWSNAGTGHSAFCELNYTPPDADGSIDITKAIQIAEQFEVSKQLWAGMTKCGALPNPRRFIRRIPHISFVSGHKPVEFLSNRYQTLQSSPLFAGMEYTEDPQIIASWAPLIMDTREDPEPVAATRMHIGTDVNFGTITKCLLHHLDGTDGGQLHLAHEVLNIRQTDTGLWEISVRNLASGDDQRIYARFVFIGAGGGSLPLLEKTGIPEAKGYGGFPVSGQWLRCTNRDIIEKHHAKVYGMAEVGAPPMSVPHLDSRFIRGRKELLFGPYAGFSTKFLKHGSYTDLFRSLGFNNIVPMMSAGARNIDLTRYLVGQALLGTEDRIHILRKHLPGAKSADWELQIAGQRVQIIKSDGKGGGVLKFGTEVVTNKTGTIAALLGASPGASTAASIMVGLLERCFPEQFHSAQWQEKLHALIPSLGHSLHNEPERCARIRAETLEQLKMATP